MGPWRTDRWEPALPAVLTTTRMERTLVNTDADATGFRLFRFGARGGGSPVLGRFGAGSAREREERRPEPWGRSDPAALPDEAVGGPVPRPPGRGAVCSAHSLRLAGRGRDGGAP
ncbi:hypothetical protein GCM10027294_10310 [Marinactinospora endophytica]